MWDSHKQWNVDLEGVYPPLYMGWDGGWGRTRRQLWSLPCEVGVGQPTWADWALGIGFLCQVPAGPLPSWSLHHRKKTFLFAFFEIICPFLVVLGCLALQYPVCCIWGTQTNQRRCCSVIFQISRSPSNLLSTSESNSHGCLLNDFQSISLDFQERSRGK